MADVAASVLRTAIACVFIGFGGVHFATKPARVMAKMIPPTLVTYLGGSADFLVKFTGVCEVCGGIGILAPQTRWLAGLMLCIFCVCVFPANWYAAQHPDRFGKFSIPLSKRLPAQVLLIAAIWWTCCSQ